MISIYFPSIGCKRTDKNAIFWVPKIRHYVYVELALNFDSLVEGESNGLSRLSRWSKDFGGNVEKTTEFRFSF